MSWQGRAYLGTMALRYFGSFLGFFVATDRLVKNPTFDVVLQVATLRQWGIAFLIMGILSIGGIVFPNQVWFKRLVVLSSGVTLCYAAALFFSLTWSPAPYSYLAFALMDLIVVGTPSLRPKRYMES